jgi:hypothetical protein
MYVGVVEIDICFITMTMMRLEKIDVIITVRLTVAREKKER